jgi:hypothetical protein
VANPTCDTTTLVTNAVCYRRKNIGDPIRQMALLVYGMVLELDAIGGTDYTDELTGTLLEDAACDFTKDERVAGLIARQFANAIAAGASVPDTVDDKVEAIACLEHVPGGMDKLEQIYLLLFCRLGVHKAYVQ